MENASNVIARATRNATPPDPAAQLPGDGLLARAAHQELQLLGMPRVNLLLTGLDAAIRKVMPLLELREPIATRCPGERLVLPRDARGGTMVLHDVGGLTHEEQLHLLGWLEQRVGRTQVVSTTSAPLLPRIRAGAFIEALYYRLNTVCVNVTG
jgi:transcriptional regulator of aromatic amino acid metabolism